MKTELPLLRGSERGDFKTCQWQWWQAWRMGYRNPKPKTDALWFGGGIHLALAHYYQPQGKGPLRGFKRGPDPVETWQKFCKDERPRFFRKGEPGDLEEKEYIAYEDLGTAMLRGYVDHYDGDPAWEFLAPEMPFSVYVPDRDGNPLLNYVGTWDGAARDHSRDGEIILIETKTTKAISTRHLILDPQSGGYDLVADAMLHDKGLLGLEENVRYIIYNFLRKAMPDTRPTNPEGYYVNKDGTVSKRQPPAYYLRYPVERSNAEKQSVLNGLVNESLQMQQIRDGVVEPTKNPGFLGENCRRCDFAEMCELHEQGGDYEEFAQNFLVQSDPYADHRPNAKSSKFL